MATTVNAYTQVAPSRFDPMALQELMMVPQYKRTQHDNILENISVAENALAQVDPLTLHSDIAKQEQAALSGKLQSHSDMLNKEGFNPSSKSQFLKLNREYQQAVSPTGSLGKIQAAKAAMENNKAAYIANASKMGYSPETLEANWAEWEAKYSQEFAETGKISNIGEKYSPNYVDTITEFDKKIQNMGMSASDIETVTSNIIYDENKGSYVTTKGSVIAGSDNEKNLESLTLWMNNQIANPNSDLSKSLKEQRKTPEDALEELKGYGNIFKKNSTTKKTSNTISNFSPIKAEDDKVTSNGGGLVIAGTQYAQSKFNGQTYGDLVATINDFENIPSDQMTDDQRADLLEIKSFKKSIDDQLHNDPVYDELKQEYEITLSELDALKNGTYDFSQDMSYNAMVNNPAVKDKELAKNNALNTIRNKFSKLVVDLENQIQEYAKPIIQNHKMQVTEYAVAPVTPKQESLQKTINNTADALLHVSPQSLEQLGNITQIIDPNGEPKSISSEADRKGIANLLFKSKPGSISAVSYVARGESGKPEMVFRVETDENNTYDMDGSMFTKGTPGYRGEIGKGDPITVRLSFNNTGKTLNNGKGQSTKVNNLLGLMQDYISTTGPVGQEFVESQKINETKSLYRGKTWNQILQDPEAATNPILKQIRRGELEKLGITPASSDQEIMDANNKLGNTTLFK